MSKTVAAKVAKELLDMQDGSVEDAINLLEESYFSEKEYDAIARSIHEQGDASNCGCGMDYDEVPLEVKGRVIADMLLAGEFDLTAEDM